LLPADGVTGIVDRLPVLVQEEAVFVCRQVVEDPLRVERIVALGRLGAHDVIVTSRGWHRRRYARRASGARKAR